MKKPDLSSFSAQQLKEELEKREREQEENEKRKRKEIIKHLVKYKGTFLKFMPHSRGSCSSTDNSGFHPEHGTAYCNRCALEALESDDDIKVIFDIRLEKV